MKKTVTMNEALSAETNETDEAFVQCISEIDRHLEEMREEQEAIRATGERTDATLAEIAEILAQLKAA
jgi:hypothetical protein